MEGTVIILIVIVFMSISCCSFIVTGGGGTAVAVAYNKNKGGSGYRAPGFDSSFFDFDDELSMEDDPFFKVDLAQSELVKAEKELMKQNAIAGTQESKDKAAAKVANAKKRVEWMKCYSALECKGTCVRFGDKVRIVKFFNDKAKLSIEKGKANEVLSNGDDTILLFQDLGKGVTGQVKEDEDLDKISQKCITYGDKTRVVRFSNQRYSLKLKSRDAYESKDENSIHTELMITGGSGKVRYGDKIRISKVGGYNLKMFKGKADEVKNDTHEGTFFKIEKA
jgi:hypothetical protein